MTFSSSKKVKLEKTAEIATKWIGSTSSLLVHTFVFIIAFILPVVGIIKFEQMLLVLTTLVSLEAIYLSIFIQMTINKSSEVIDIIQEDVGEIQEDIQEIEGDIDEIQKDVDVIQGETIGDQLNEIASPDALTNIEKILSSLQKEIELLKESTKTTPKTLSPFPNK